MLATVGRDLASTVSENWFRIDFRFWSTGTMAQSELTVVERDGATRAVPVPFSVVGALRELRAEMYEPGRGTWFSLRYTIDPPMEYRVLFDYDDDPQWWPEIAPEEWATDLRAYPRNPEHIPDWLRAKLPEAE
ncbi:hypothetical protein [Nocardia mexicana]|uniref:hypothetical protein n=1 Tax=Nocardia mexicana TaxID=279262 RepID=UPI000A05F25F|nr:hypothetical protein [Nocardia mexicana]